MQVDRRPGLHVSDLTAHRQRMGGFEPREPKGGTAAILRTIGVNNLVLVYSSAGRIRGESGGLRERYIATEKPGSRPGSIDEGILVAATGLRESNNVQTNHPLHLLADFTPETIARIQKASNVRDSSPQTIFGYIDLKSDPRKITLGAVDAEEETYWRMNLHASDLAHNRTVFLNGVEIDLT